MAHENDHIWQFYVDRYPYPVEMLMDALGLIPGFLVPGDPRPAVEQFAERYQGGWDVMPGFALIDGAALKYPGDPLMDPIARVTVNGDLVLVYSGSWVCVVRPDRTFEVARLD